jgi:multidrug efflux system membrane fusion protein
MRRFFAAAVLLLWAAADPTIVSAQNAPPPIPVTVAAPVAKRITQWDEYWGRFEAVERVDVRARVSGFIEQLHFKDGAMVKAGDLLFTIDKRPFQIAVDVAKAEVARTQSQVEMTKSDVERAEPLVKTKVLSDQVFEQRKSAMNVATAQMQSAQASLKSAELNLEWTEVRAPISGRISDRKVSAGNLIAGGQAGANLLATIVSLDPIHFVFDISEADYLHYSRLRLSGERASSGEGTEPVRLKLSDETAWAHEGRMNFIDNALNERSATLRGRAVFDNKNGLLTPGVFARLALYGGEFDALLVPDSAVVSDQASKILLTVNADNVVTAAPVVLGQISDGLRVVRSGLKPDDRVIIEGIANPMVRAGTKVAPQPGEIKTVQK